MKRVGAALGLGAWALLALAPARAGSAEPSPPEMVRIPSGSYVPFFPEKLKSKSEEPVKRDPIAVEEFTMDVYPVTNEQFLEFVKRVPRWRKSRISRVFAEPKYLETWKSDLELPSPRAAKSPVTQVSWFAANAYCHWLGKELPATDQWEYAAADGGRGSERIRAEILQWYGRPTPKVLPPVRSSAKNGYRVSGLHGLVWEWTRDFNSLMASDEGRASGTTDNNMFCGNGSQGALDPSDYVSFMRYSLRNSLKATYTVGNLGFRCVKEIQ